MNLDIIPNGAIKRVHVSQNDIGRTLTFNLFSDSVQYTVPTGATVKIQGTKPSGFGFSETCTVSGNVVTVDTTEAMTDEYGYIQTELSISYGNVVIGTSNFVLAVEKNPHPDNTTDGTQITAQSLQVQIDELADAIETDTTLSVSGKPADAKVVGDAISDLIGNKVDKDGVGQVTGKNISLASSTGATYNALEEIGTITVGGYIDAFNPSTNEPVVSTGNPNANLVYIPLDGTETTIVIPFGTASNIYYGRVLTFVTSSNKRIVFFSYAHLSSNADLTPYLSNNNGIYTFNIADFKIANKTWDTGYSSSQATGLYIAYPKNATEILVNKSSGEYSVDIEDIQWLNTDSLKPLDVVLPSNIYGVTGQQINIYKANLCLHNRLRMIPYIHTRIANSYQSDERTIWTPTATTLTSVARGWEIFRNGLLEFETQTVTYNEVPKNTGSGSIKVLVIGDSKIEAGFVTNYFREMFNDDNMTCTLLGTQYTWTTANAHEGYGGKTAKWFCTNASSPFCNNGAFDFANYLTTNSIDTPDFVFINLGTNDCAESATAYKTDFPTYINQMITSIHSVSTSINVIVGLCEGIATIQDTNNSELLKWDLNEKISDLHRISIAEWDNRQSEHIYVCPMYMGMDLTQDYNMTEVPLSSWDEKRSTGKTRNYITDTVHQSGVGYGKNADYMYAIVKYIVASN